MDRYGNFSGHSGVRAFEIYPHAILIEFVGGDTYLYDENKPGPEKLSAMKRLAREGKGLSTYVSQNVRGNYAKKIR